MKKLICLLTALVLVVGMCLTASAEGVALTVTADKTCKPGSTITVHFGLPKNSNIAAAGFRVKYDFAKFQFKEYQNGALAESAIAVGNQTEDDFLYALATTNPITDGGELFSITFLVDSDASGDYKFAFSADNCTDFDSNTINVSGASVTVKVNGEAVSKVKVQKPVLEQETVSTVSTDGASGVASDAGQTTPAASDADEPAAAEEEKSDSNQLLILIIVLIVLVAIAVTVFLILRKKGPKEEASAPSILDEEAAKLLKDDDEPKF